MGVGHDDVGVDREGFATWAANDEAAFRIRWPRDA